MDTKRFGRKLKLPATAAIKHQMRILMLEDLVAADASAAAIPPHSKEAASQAVVSRAG